MRRRPLRELFAGNTSRFALTGGGWPWPPCWPSSPGTTRSGSGRRRLDLLGWNLAAVAGAVAAAFSLAPAPCSPHCARPPCRSPSGRAVSRSCSGSSRRDRDAAAGSGSAGRRGQVHRLVLPGDVPARGGRLPWSAGRARAPRRRRTRLAVRRLRLGAVGDFKPFRNDIDDGADTVAWLRTQAWFGGRFALCGASYLGATAWALMTDPPPELAAAVITTSAHDTHWVTHGAGAFSLEGTLSLLDGLEHLESGAVAGLLRLVTAGRRLRPAFEELPLTRAGEIVLGAGGQTYREWLTAPNAQDPLWRPMRLGRALESVNVPVLLLEGWQDQFVAQMIEEYDHLRRRGVDVGLTIGPWTHVQAATRGAPILIGETLDWLAEHLAGVSQRQRPSPVHIFVTGARVASPADMAPPHQGTGSLPFARWRAGALATECQLASLHVPLRPGRSHSRSWWPGDKPGACRISRQPQARGARRRPHFHQPTDG